MAEHGAGCDVVRVVGALPLAVPVAYPTVIVVVFLVAFALASHASVRDVGAVPSASPSSAADQLPRILENRRLYGHHLHAYQLPVLPRCSHRYKASARNRYDPST